MSQFHGLSIKSSKDSPAVTALKITLRVAAGITALTLLLMNLAVWLNLIPNVDSRILKDRKALTETLAVTYSGAMQLHEEQHILPMLKEIVHRNPGLLSMGVRDNAGHLVVEIGDHEAHWTNRTGKLSTATEMKVPLAMQNTPVGELETRFAPLQPKTVLGFLHTDNHSLFAFIVVGGFAIYGGFVWLILRKVLTITKSDAIPKRIRDSLNTLAEGILILDKQMRIVLSNHAFSRLVESSPEEVEGKTISQLPWVRPADQDAATPYPWDQSVATGDAYTGKLLNLRNGQAMASLSVNSTPIRGLDNTYRGTMISVDNLTKIEKKNRQLRNLIGRLRNSRVEIKKKNVELEFLAYRDPLTKCLNRRAFFEQLSAQARSARRYNYPLCCIMLDIDHFKSVNDTFGHAVGDEVIEFIAQQMKLCRRSSDIVARYGGEEFVMLLPHVTLDQAEQAGERLRKAVEEAPRGNVRVTISVGVAEFDEHVKDTDMLLSHADTALYAAKHAGRNRVCRWDMLPDAERRGSKVGAR